MTTCEYSVLNYMSSLIFRPYDIGKTPVQGYKTLLIIGLYLLISLVIDGEINFLRTQMTCHVSKYIWLVFSRYLMDFGDLRPITSYFLKLYFFWSVMEKWLRVHRLYLRILESASVAFKHICHRTTWSPSIWQKIFL